jgi:MFS family permease
MQKKTFLDYMGLGDLKKHGWRGILAFWMVTAIAFFLFADQNLIAPNLQNIGRSFGFTTDAEIDWYLGGLIPILFFILGGAVSLSMGYLSQRYSRKNLLLFTLFLGEGTCLLSGLARNYTEFTILRTLTGFGLGGVFPLLFSVLGDYFTSRSRAVAAGYLSLAMGLGIGVGQLLGGILGQADPVNGWRMSFIVVAAPSFLFALVYWLFCPEPVRGGAEKELEGIADELSIEVHRFTTKDLKAVLSSKTNIGIFLQGIPGTVPWGVFFTFMMDYYERYYGFAKDQAAGMVTLAAVGVFVGTFFGGIIGQWLYNRRKKLQPIFCSVTTMLGVIPSLYLLQANAIAGTPLFIVLNIFTGFLISLTGSNVRAILINTNPPRNRSAVFAVYNLTDDLGRGLGPAISAVFLTMIPDRTLALSISILFWIPCSLIWLYIMAHYESDEQHVHAELEQLAASVKS